MRIIVFVGYCFVTVVSKLNNHQTKKGTTIQFLIKFNISEAMYIFLNFLNENKVLLQIIQII